MSTKKLIILQRKAKKSSRYYFIAKNRSGPLTKKNHIKLITWAIKCVKHTLFKLNIKINLKLKYVLYTATKWKIGKTSTSKAMNASLIAHKVARQTKNLVYKSIARAIGQTVATAHFADHSLGATFYLLKAIKLNNKNLENEKKWQTKTLQALLPFYMAKIAKTTWKKKKFDKRI